MGVVYADTELTNLKEDGGSYACPFLVNTRATYSVVPAQELDKIGVARENQQVFELADGSLATFDVGYAFFRVAGEKVVANVVFGEKGCEPLLGLTTLGPVGLYIDPVSQVLRKADALFMK
ncbi:MAG: hypothetical protein LBI54_02790 [Lachnospiraceae bacterium]|nr:hypothetical protein [Lachnospiraceae bacterium]